MLRHHFGLGVIITVVDAFNAALHEELHSEWMAQVTAADRLVLTKTDLASPKSETKLRTRLRIINPTAVVMTNDDVREGDSLLLDGGLHEIKPDLEAERWLENFSNQPPEAEHLHHSDHEHSGVNSFCVVFSEQINWTAFGLWLSMLLNRHGRNILRVKGILNLSGSDYPVAIHGVQHLVHPPVHLSAWPNEDRRSRIVFIVRDIASAAIEQSLNIFLRSLS